MSSHGSLQSLQDSSLILTCPVCIELAAPHRAPQAVTPSPAAIAAPDDQDDAPAQEDTAMPGPRKRGRPRKDEAACERWSLSRWVAKCRSTIYMQTSKSNDKSATYFCRCRACQKEIKFGTQTCEVRVLKHETYKTHVQGLKRLCGPGDGAVQNTEIPSESSSTQQACPGVLASRHVLATSIALFVQHGQPRLKYAPGETDPLSCVTFEPLPEDIAIRSKQCKGRLQGATACSECMGAAKGRKLKEAIARMAYMVDLCMLTFKCFHSSADELQRFKEELRERDYQDANLAGQDLDRLLRPTNKLEVCQAICAKLDHTPAWRITPSVQQLWNCWLMRPQRHHGTSVEAEAYGCLVQGMTDAVASGKAKEFDLVLASRVAAGALRSDVLVESLCTSFLAKLRAGLSDSRRRTTSEFANYPVLAESLGTLGKHQELSSLLRSFCVNPRNMPAISLVSERCPEPFVSVNQPARLREGYMRALSLLKAGGTRPHLICDETTWAADWSQVRNVTRDSEGNLVDRFVGGVWRREPEEDMSLLDPDEGHSASTLPAEKLAKMALHVAVQRADSTRHLFDICVLPRGPGVGSAEDTLDVVAQIFHECTEAAGVAPNGMAFDGGANNVRLLQLFVGQLDNMRSLPFFKECSIQQLDLPFWGFSFLKYKEEVLVASNGAFHWQKRYSLAHLSGCRKILHGSVWIDLSCELGHGLPHASYLASDVQSDVAAAQRMSPPYIGKDWCSLAVNLHSMLGGIICSCTTASTGFSSEDVCLNAMTGYYMLLLHRAEAGRRWPESLGLM